MNNQQHELFKLNLIKQVNSRTSPYEDLMYRMGARNEYVSKRIFNHSEYGITFTLSRKDESNTYQVNIEDSLKVSEQDRFSFLDVSDKKLLSRTTKLVEQIEIKEDDIYFNLSIYLLRWIPESDYQLEWERNESWHWTFALSGITRQTYKDLLNVIRNQIESDNFIFTFNIKDEDFKTITSSEIYTPDFKTYLIKLLKEANENDSLSATLDIVSQFITDKKTK